jgi:hypothetical protein
LYLLINISKAHIAFAVALAAGLKGGFNALYAALTQQSVAAIYAVPKEVQAAPVVLGDRENLCFGIGL